MKNKSGKRLLCAALLLCLFASLAVPAAAAGLYPVGQQYLKDNSLSAVYAVQVGCGSEEEAVALRDRVLGAGFDAYLYQERDFIALYGKLRARMEASGLRDYLLGTAPDASLFREPAFGVLCGKFRDEAEAAAYLEELRAAGLGEDASVTQARLDDGAIGAFETMYEAEKKAASVLIRTSSWEPTKGSRVYSVDLCTTNNVEYAAGLCEKLQKAGFDAFLLETNGYYRVMSGKFHDICNALNYRDCIWSNTDQTDTYISEIELPVEQIAAFETDFEKNGLPGPIKSGLEKPTGPFYRESKGSTLAYTVQFSAGTSFGGAERSRDAMSAQGFPSFVYECSRIYEIMTGAFHNKADAEAWCAKVKANTSESDAYVTRAWLPASMVK